MQDPDMSARSRQRLRSFIEALDLPYPASLVAAVAIFLTVMLTYFRNV